MLPGFAEAYEPVGGYLNTASLGLPAHETLRVVRDALTDWQAGRTDPPAFDSFVDRGRAAFARIAGGVAVEQVAILSQVSVASGMVAASLPDNATVLGAQEDFTSVLFPFLEAVSARGITVRTVPLDRLIESVDSSVDLVAVSAAQSADGTVLDLDGLVEAAADSSARTYVDATQAAGWLAFDASRFDVTATGGYKWLCTPRGAGFLTVSDRALEWLRPTVASWFGGDDPWTSIYGPPLRLADDARRFNVSPAWFAVAGAAPAVELLADIGPATIGEYSIGLANSFRARVGLEPGVGPTVAVETPHAERVREAGIAAAVRAGRVRVSFYGYNTLEDAERAAAALGYA